MGGLTGLQGQPVKGMDSSLSRLSHLYGVQEKDIQEAEIHRQDAHGTDACAPAARTYSPDACVPAARTCSPDACPGHTDGTAGKPIMSVLTGSVVRQCEQPDLKAHALRLIEELKQRYPGITIWAAEEEGDRANLAAGLGEGLHLVISREFLDRMQGSRDGFDTCSRVLAQKVSELAAKAGNEASWGAAGHGAAMGVFLGKDYSWSWAAAAREHDQSADKRPLEDMLAADQAKVVGDMMGGSSGNTGAVRVICRKSYNVSDQYRKMASARSSGQVQQVMGDIQRNIVRLKMASVYGDDEQRVKANRAVRSLQKLLGRGGRKVRRLNREKLKQCAKKKALERNEEKKSRKLELELKRMRSARKGSDHALVKEGMADEAYIRGYRRYRGIRDDYGPVPMAGEIGVPVMPGGMDVCGAGETGGGINPGDIVVSGESTF
ncbi:MAG: hypothetical protein ACLUN9_07760 [Enterocloster aldenensis]